MINEYLHKHSGNERLYYCLILELWEGDILRIVTVYFIKIR